MTEPNSPIVSDGPTISPEVKSPDLKTTAILQQLVEGVILTDALMRITFVNQAANQLHGVAELGVAVEDYTKAYHLLTMDGEPYPPEDLPLARAVLRAETVVNAFWRIQRLDGTEVIAQGDARPILGDDGIQEGAVLTIRDVTAQHNAEQSAKAEARAREVVQRTLEEKREHLRLLLEASLDGVVEIDTDSHIVYWNTQAQIIFGWSREEVLGQVLADLVIPSEHRGAHLVKDEAGNIREVILVHDDVTERLKAAEGLKKKAEEVAALNERLKRSIQETHHRVKNNLQIISALVDLQTEEGQDTIPASAMHRMGQHSRSLAAIHDLLTQQVTTDAHTDSISAKAAMDKLIPLLQMTTGGRDISYTVDDFRLPVQEGDSLALLISELVSNAVKHGRDQIELTLTLNGDMARLEICDDGPGFPHDFNPQSAANTGMSLIDSAGRHDLRGTISYENHREGGARMVVAFPISRTQ